MICIVLCICETILYHKYWPSSKTDKIGFYARKRHKRHDGIDNREKKEEKPSRPDSNRRLIAFRCPSTFPMWAQHVFYLFCLPKSNKAKHRKWCKMDLLLQHDYITFLRTAFTFRLDASTVGVATDRGGQTRKCMSINQWTVDSSIPKHTWDMTVYFFHHFFIQIRFHRPFFFVRFSCCVRIHFVYLFALYEICFLDYSSVVCWKYSLPSGISYLPFCMIWAREKPDSSTKPSEQYTIGYPDTWAFPRTKFESAKNWKRENKSCEQIVGNMLRHEQMCRPSESRMHNMAFRKSL